MNHHHSKILDLEGELSAVREEQTNFQKQLKTLQDTPIQPIENQTVCEIRIRELEKANGILAKHLRQGKKEYDEKELQRSTLEVQRDNNPIFEQRTSDVQAIGCHNEKEVASGQRDRS